MYQTLIDLFVKRREHDTDNTMREKYGNFAGVVGIVFNFILAAIKLVIGFITSSVSIRADAINNLSDSVTSIVSIAAFKIASKPADKKHPFGHARIEYIVSMLLSFFLILIGIDLMKESLNKIVNPVEAHFTVPVLIILFITVLVKIWLAFLYKFVTKKIDSCVVEANAADSLSDALSTGAVLVSAVISRFTSLNLDGYVGVLVSVFLLINALKILNETKNHILGTEPDIELIKQIHDYAMSSEEIVGIHDMFIHNYGPGRCFATLHAEVDGKKDIFTTHDAVDNVEKGIFDKFGVHCTIHLDPIVTDDENVISLKNSTEKIIEGIDSSFTIHDFRIVPGDTHTNLIFDVLVPFECKMHDEEIKRTIESEIKTLSTSYFTVVTIDRGEKI
ncbi:MAG: cation transporter [Clostridia bacterium]|nr:cation transporter [Clostridia bacterium]